MDKISIIVPVYKAEAYLHRCIDSILHQSYRNLELILVEDGSPDCSGAICDAYAEADDRVVVIHQKNAGVSAARNAGICWVMENSSSQWITFVDSDDWIHREYLEVLLAAVLENHTDMVVCNMLWTNAFCEDAPLKREKIQIVEGERMFTDHYDATLSVCCKLMHRRILTNIRFPEGIRYEDAAVCHLMLFEAGSVAVCPEVLYYYFFNEESFTRGTWTETRMDVIPVHRDRLASLQKHGYQKGYCKELEVYAERITESLCSLTDLIDTNTDYRKSFETLRAELRNVVREAEELGVFHFDRERLMTYTYVYRSNIVWRAARGLQRIWRKALGR